jgi:hypothetical protein
MLLQDCHKKFTHKRVYVLVIKPTRNLSPEQFIFDQLHGCQTFAGLKLNPWLPYCHFIVSRQILLQYLKQILHLWPCSKAMHHKPANKHWTIGQMHPHTYTHTHTHAIMHAHTHTHMCNYIINITFLKYMWNACTNIYTHTLTHTHTHKHAHTHVKDIRVTFIACMLLNMSTYI